MPITPKPFVCKCADCDWQEIYSPVSGVLLNAPPDVCPKCGSEQLAVKSASTIDKLALWFTQLVPNKA